MKTDTGLELVLDDGGSETPIRFVPKRLIVAGWTGRDREKMEKHMAELEEIGIARPETTPVFYRASTSRLSTSSFLQNTGGNSSGEVEFVIFNIDGELWIGAGSDHTDRAVETYNITVSKQMCDKPIAQRLWRYADLRDHWDEIEIRSYATIGGERFTYQQGTVAAMLSVDDLIARFEETTGSTFAPGDVMMGGTLGAIGGIRPASEFFFELRDNRTGRTISHTYKIEELPLTG